MGLISIRIPWRRTAPFEQVASINAQALNSKDLNGGACGGPTALFPDHTGTVLYDLDFYSDCANNAYQLFSVDHSSGSLSYIGVTSVTTPIFEVPLSFLGNNQFAYGASCYHWYQEIFGFTRNRDGSLTSLGVNPTLGPPMPVSQAGEMYCPYLTASDPTNHLAVPVQPLDNSSLQPVGPYQLATYTADSSGNLTTTSTYSNRICPQPRLPRTARFVRLADRYLYVPIWSAFSGCWNAGLTGIPFQRRESHHSLHKHPCHRPSRSDFLG